MTGRRPGSTTSPGRARRAGFAAAALAARRSSPLPAGRRHRRSGAAAAPPSALQRPRSAAARRPPATPALPQPPPRGRRRRRVPAEFAASRREPAGRARQHQRLLQLVPHHGGRVHPVRPERRAVRGRLLPQPPGQDPLPLPPAGQARRHRRRQHVAIKDGKTKTQDLYPLSKTPLRYLLADQHRPDLADARQRGPRGGRPDLASSSSSRSALVDGKLTLIFDRKTYELRQWIVTDAQGLNTSVAIFNIDHRQAAGSRTSSGSSSPASSAAGERHPPPAPSGLLKPAIRRPIFFGQSGLPIIGSAPRLAEGGPPSAGVKPALR